MKICLIDETGAGDGALSVLAARWGLEHDEDNLMALVFAGALNCASVMSRSWAASLLILLAGDGAPTQIRRWSRRGGGESGGH